MGLVGFWDSEVNIEKMEKTAKDFVDKPTALNHTKFIQSSNPAAILELIERLKVAEHHLGNILSDPFAEDCQECAVGTSTSWENAKAALARANGESNEN